MLMLNWTVWNMVNTTCNKFQAYRDINGNKIHCLEYYFLSPNIEFFHKVKDPYNPLHSVLRNICYYVPVMYSLVLRVHKKGKWHSITITVRNQIHSYLVVCSWALFSGTLYGNVTKSLINCTVWNLVSDIKGGTQTEGVWEQGVEENIWTEERWSDGRLEKTTHWGAS
jgi:hypothetical protein